MKSAFRLILLTALLASIACVPAFISDCFQSSPSSISHNCDEQQCIINLFKIDLFSVTPEASRHVELPKGEYTFGVYLEPIDDLMQKQIKNNPILTIRIYEKHGRLIRELPLEITKAEIEQSFAKRANGSFLYAGQMVFIPPSAPNDNFAWASTKGFWANSNPPEPAWLKSYPILECDRTMRYCITVDKFITDDSFKRVGAFVAVVK